MTGQGAGVKFGHARDAVVAQIRVEIFLRAPIARRSRQGAQQKPGTEDLAAFGIFGVNAHIADVGVGQGNDLPAIGWIRQDLLITGHCRVEANLAGAHGCSAEAHSMKDTPIGQCQDCVQIPPRIQIVKMQKMGARMPPMDLFYSKEPGTTGSNPGNIELHAENCFTRAVELGNMPPS